MKLLIGLAAGAGVFCLLALTIMLLLGGFHHEVSSSVPPLGFWASALVAMALSMISGLLRN